MQEPQPQTPPTPRRNVKLVIAYNGRAYHGWQKQIDGIDTVQLRIEHAAVRVMAHPVTVFGASRTDAGVHAAGQVANFHSDNFAIPTHAIRRAMNSRLPGDIVVRSAVDVPDGFHSSRSATGKTYRYRIYTAPLKPVELHGLAYHFWRPLDVEPMRLAAVRLVGTHDFRGFATSAEVREDTVRTVFSCRLERTEDEIVLEIQGNGFLYHMVRNIVGTLVEIGRGRWTGEQIDKIIASRDRADAGPTAPPDGLSLLCVHYETNHATGV